MMHMSPGAVNKYLVIWQENLFSLFACPYWCGSAQKTLWKQGAGGDAADMSQRFSHLLIN